MLMNVGLCFGESCLFKSEQVSKLRDCWDTPQQLDIGQADIYIYIVPPKKTYVAGICNILCLFLAAFWTLVFWSTIYIYIYCARRLHSWLKSWIL